MNEDNFSYIIDDNNIYRRLMIMAKGIIHDKDWNDKGIYGIFVNDELFYIGMTMESFGRRFSAHRRHVYEVINGT